MHLSSFAISCSRPLFKVVAEEYPASLPHARQDLFRQHKIKIGH